MPDALAGCGMWEWAIRYDLGPRRCGSRGWVFDATTALDRVKTALEGLPRGVTASGEILHHPPDTLGAETPPVHVAYDVERTAEGMIHWYPKVDGPQP